MTRPTDPFEAVSYDLNKLRERRMAERRAIFRATPDRRQQKSGNGELQKSSDAADSAPSDQG